MMKAFAAACMVMSGIAAAQTLAVNPSAMKKVASVDERFQSYNVEMVEVTGGRFWRPMDEQSYASIETAKSHSNAQQVGTDPALYEYRAPLT